MHHIHKHHDNTVTLPRPLKYPATTFNFDFVSTMSSKTSNVFFTLFPSSGGGQHPILLLSPTSQFSSSAHPSSTSSFPASTISHPFIALDSILSNIPVWCKKSLSSFEMSYDTPAPPPPMSFPSPPLFLGTIRFLESPRECSPDPGPPCECPWSPYAPPCVDPPVPSPLDPPPPPDATEDATTTANR